MRVFFLSLICCSTLASASELTCQSRLIAPSLSLAAKVMNSMPTSVRRGLRTIAPSSAISQLEALQAELARILPEDLSERVLRQGARADTDLIKLHLDYEGPPAWRRLMNRAEKILNEIVEISSEVYGQRSPETAMAHFSLSIFHSYVSWTMRDESRWKSVQQAIKEGKEANLIFSSLNSPTEAAVRLHTIRQLVRLSADLSFSNVSKFDGKAIAPHSEFAATIQEARLQIDDLMNSYMSMGLSAESATWIFINTQLQAFGLEGLDQTMAKRARGERMTMIGYSEDPEFMVKNYDRMKDMLAIAVANPKVLQGLLDEGRDGSLHNLINSLRWANYHFMFMNSPIISKYIAKDLAEKRQEILFGLEGMLHSNLGNLTLEHFLAALRDMEFDVPNYKTSVKSLPR